MAADESANETSVVITLHSPLSSAQAQEACWKAGKLLASGSGCLVVCDVSGHPDLRTVDVLARLTLLTQRGNGRLLIRARGDVDQSLERLIALSGLTCLDGLRLERLEPRRQPEAGK